MNQTIRVVLGPIGAMFCVLLLSRPASAQALPDGKGKAEFVRICTPCHRTELIVRVKKTPDDWKKNVDDMVARGADGTQEEIDSIVLYLVTNFSTDKPAQTAPIPSSISTIPALLDTAAIRHVEQLIAEDDLVITPSAKVHTSYNRPSNHAATSDRSSHKLQWQSSSI